MAHPSANLSRLATLWVPLRVGILTSVRNAPQYEIHMSCCRDVSCIRYNYFGPARRPEQDRFPQPITLSHPSTVQFGYLNLRRPMESRSAELPASNARSLLVSFSPMPGPARASSGRDEIAADAGVGRLSRPSDERPRRAPRLAAEWHATGELRCVVACGGDGTAAIVRNHTPLDVPLLLVPLGTENLLGRYVSQSAAAGRSPRRRSNEACRRFPWTWAAAAGTATGRHYFLTMISAGFDAEVVRRLHERRRGNITRLSYVQPTLAAIRSYEYPEMQLYCHDDAGDRLEPLRCRWVFGFNLPLYARGWQVAPEAVGTDGLLDVCTFRTRFAASTSPGTCGT